MHNFPSVHINEHRFLSRMQKLAEIGATAKGGVCRLAASKEDAEARSLLGQWCEELGWKTFIDPIGNQFARKSGKQPQAKRILLGSHLDSQPTGGRFDGVLGVLAALEAMQTIQELQIVHHASIDLVNWTNEEGARFAPAMMGSGVYTGSLQLSDAYNTMDSAGVKLEDCLRDIGWLGNDQIDSNYAASFELHIEQGPILEAKNTPIGIVQGVQGIRWYEATVHGMETHAGPTPMQLRDDPVQKASKLISSLYNWVLEKGEDARLTIGQCRTQPASINTVPSSVHFSIDIRHPQEHQLNIMHKELHEYFESKHCELKDLWHSPVIHFNSDCLNDIHNATQSLNIPTIKLFSGAGHDSVYLSQIIPTAMIFVPSKDGLSHNEAEFTADEYLIKGANVLLHATLECLKRTESHAHA